MTQDLTPTTADQTPAPVDSVKERARIKRDIRNGRLPRYKVEMKRIKTGPHPKQHRLELKLISTMSILMKDLEPKKESA